MTIRPAEATDFDAMLDVAVAANEADRSPYPTTASDIEHELGTPGLELNRDVVVAVDDETVVGFAWTIRRPSGSGSGGRVSLNGAVHPDARGRGHGSTLMAAQRERFMPLAAEGWSVRGGHWSWMEDVAELYRDNGFRPVRVFELMRRPVTSDVATFDEPAELVGWEPPWSHSAREVFNEAFAGHWGFTPTDASEWEHRIIGEGFLPDLSRLAVVDGKVVGASVSSWFSEDAEFTGRKEAWLSRVGVVEAFRGRGLATSMIRAFLAEASAAGFTHAALAVDRDSETSAPSLYRRLGFETDESTIAQEWVGVA